LNAEERIKFLAQELFTGEEAQEAGTELAQLLYEKHSHYTDSILRVPLLLEVLYPNGIKPEQYTDLALVVRVCDKLMRVCLGNRASDRESPWRDIGGYGILGEVSDRHQGFGRHAPEYGEKDAT
jgi:hypothetical protein